MKKIWGDMKHKQDSACRFGSRRALRSTEMSGAPEAPWRSADDCDSSRVGKGGIGGTRGTVGSKFDGKFVNRAEYRRFTRSEV